MLAEKWQKKNREKQRGVQRRKEQFAGTGKHPVDGKRIEHGCTTHVYYSTDYANNPASFVDYQLRNIQHRDARENIRCDIFIGIVQVVIILNENLYKIFLPYFQFYTLI